MKAIDNKHRTVNTFREMKKRGTRISMVTAYDHAMARCVAQSDVDLILVGDSLGMVVLGYENTLQVTMADMVHHSAAVRRGAPEAFIIADMPFMSYHSSLEQTKQNAAELIVKGGANAVKLEGGSMSRIDAVEAIVDCEIPVCAHIGLTPQSIHRFGGYKVQGKSAEEHDELMSQAWALQRVGAFMIVLEGVPELLAKEITAELSIPTIGIGAGRYTDGQVLVWHDLLGFNPDPAKFVKVFSNQASSTIDALNTYTAEIRDAVFPAESNTYYPIKTEEK
jgi:3-methyl-2-oxobutanoate hydroxymethyltransferase